MNIEYHRLRPRDLVERRRETPVAYLGLGILEWHGLHNPLGLDGTKADGVAKHLAARIGGVVMPPLFWGDNRSEICELVFDPAVSPWLPAGTTDHTADISRHMDIETEAFAADGERSKSNGGWRLWKELLVHMLHQIEALRFEILVVIPGHYPLFDPVLEAIDIYTDEGGKVKTLVLTDKMYSDCGNSGDHAAAFETSLMMALEPDLVDLSELESDPAIPPVGVLGDDPRMHASKEFGEKILARFVEITRKWIKKNRE